jgi:phenylacetate-coenzyme A ligase PaaK-like adenylate-forming protein
LIDSHRLDAAAPPAQIVARLNQLQPQVLVGYASMVRMLAEEQLAGRLQVAPQAVNSASEPLTAEGRALVQQAWHVPPFDVYAATETGGIAAECEQHTGMHPFEDLVLAEVVDTDGRPVPPGITGDRLLVTVLFSRTPPLIRYQLTDRVRLATSTVAPRGSSGKTTWSRSTASPPPPPCTGSSWTAPAAPTARPSTGTSPSASGSSSGW